MHLCSGKHPLHMSPLLEFSSRLWEIIQCVSSCSLSTGAMPGVSIPWKALTGSPTRGSLIWQENSFFSISEKISTELVHTTWEKEPIQRHHNQEFLSFPVQLYHQNFERTQAWIWLHSGKQTLLISQLDFSYNYGTETNGLPIGLRAMVWCSEISIAWKTLQTCSPFRRGQIGHDHVLFAQVGKSSPGLVHTNRAEWPSQKLQKTREWKNPGCFIQ